MSASPAVRHLWPLRVYYEDTDFSGVVYHAGYLRFLERGRTEFLRAIGIDQSAMFKGSASAFFAVRHMDIDFIAPARMDDLLSVETSIEAIGGASITMAQAITLEGRRLVSATVRVALVADGRAKRLPPELLARLTKAGPGIVET